MNIKNKLWRAAGIAATAAAIGALGLTGVASASTAQPAADAASRTTLKVGQDRVVQELDTVARDRLPSTGPEYGCTGRVDQGNPFPSRRQSRHDDLRAYSSS